MIAPSFDMAVAPAYGSDIALSAFFDETGVGAASEDFRPLGCSSRHEHKTGTRANPKKVNV